MSKIFGTLTVYKKLIVQKYAEQVIYNSNFKIQVLLEKAIQILYIYTKGEDYTRYSQFDKQENFQ